MLNAINANLAKLNQVTEQMRDSGQEYARAEARYQAAKARRALELRADGEPATVVSLIIKGDDDVNGYLMRRECARALYEADRELINTLKLTIRIQENQIQREWSQS